ncbi:hypothetical protein HNR62_002370 [Oceanisphaera litoralis]|uniref:hypothetical protein n=1 Tax=Oceanisphaera litoralis TaxID=225144 RepID=UPI00195A2449|nr:hypothetical protein [Oceanisphaera litoralis]MBM7456480.1 hypothetical protein [Oceanisphaera litoralis]
MLQPLGRRLMVVSLIAGLLAVTAYLGIRYQEQQMDRRPVRTPSLDWPTPDNT